MGRRTFDVVDLTELFVHWEAGRSQVQISESLNLDRKTVRKFLAPALAEGLVPGGPPAGELVWAQRIAGWFPGLSDARLRQVTWPAIEVHRDYIVKQLADEVTVSTISSRLTAEKGLTASESSVRRWITANLAEEAARRRVSVPRGPVEPGSEAQIDYGRLGSWTDPATGTRHIVQAFVMVLACSRLIFVRPVIRMDQTSWCDSHVEAFAFFQWLPGPVGAGQPEDRCRPAGPLRSADQPGVCRTRRPLRCARRPGSGVQAEGQGLGFILRLLGWVG